MIWIYIIARRILPLRAKFHTWPKTSLKIPWNVKKVLSFGIHRLPTEITLIFCTEFYYHANMSTNGNTRSRWCYYCCLVEKNKLTLLYSFKTVQMTRHKNMRILGTKYAQSARQSDITIQSRCFNWAKTLKTILNIFVINTNHI